MIRPSWLPVAAIASAIAGVLFGVWLFAVLAG